MLSAVLSSLGSDSTFLPSERRTEKIPIWWELVPPFLGISMRWGVEWLSKMDVKRLIQELVCNIEIECGNTMRGWGESSL